MCRFRSSIFCSGALLASGAWFLVPAYSADLEVNTLQTTPYNFSDNQHLHITSSGKIDGGSQSAVTAAGKTGVTLTNDGEITSTGDRIIDFANSNNASFTNTATLSALGSSQSGTFYATGSNQLTFANTGEIKTKRSSLFLNSIKGMNLTNSGVISSETDSGIVADFGDGLTFTNESSGRISGAAFGINLSFAKNVGLINHGKISGDLAGLDLTFSKDVTITNHGEISSISGQAIKGGVLSKNITIVNKGTINSKETLDFSNSDGVVIENHANIVTESEKAIALSNGDDVVKIYKDSVIVGTLDFGAGDDKLEIAETNPDRDVLVEFESKPETIQLPDGSELGTDVEVTADKIVLTPTRKIAATDNSLLVLGDNSAIVNFKREQLAMVSGSHSGIRQHIINPKSSRVASDVGAVPDEESQTVFGLTGALIDPDSVGYSVWSRAYGGYKRTPTTENGSSAMKSSHIGGVSGVDFRLDSDLMVGGFLGVTSSKTWSEAGTNSVNGVTGYGGIHSRYSLGELFVGASMNYGFLSQDTKRLQNNEVFSGRSDTHFFGGSMIAGYDLRIEDVLMRPKAGVSYTVARVGGYSEGSATNAVSIDANWTQIFTAWAGADIEYHWDLGERGTLGTTLSAAYEYENVTSGELLTGTLAGNRLTLVESADGVNHSIVSGLRLDYEISPETLLSLSGTSKITHRGGTEYSGWAGFRYNF